MTREVARDLGFDAGFIEFIFAESRPPCFEYCLEPPGNGWTCHIPDEYEAAYPLWSQNGDQTLVCVSGQNIYFINGYHDDPDVTVKSRTDQGLLAEIFIDMYESEESEEALREASLFSGFAHLDQVLEFCEREGGNDYDDERKQLIAAIDHTAARTE
jgi:hypothetical protein